MNELEQEMNHHPSRTCLCQAGCATSSPTALKVVQQPLQCGGCVQRALQPFQKRHEQAQLSHAIAKEKCSRHFSLSDTSSFQKLGDWQAESQRLRDRLSELQQHCSSLAVRLASQAVENDDHREQLAARDHFSNELCESHIMDRLEDNLLHGGMSHALQVATNQVKVLRFQLAVRALQMHRLDVEQPESHNHNNGAHSNNNNIPSLRNQPHRQQRARGIGKIGGLPLPHAGMELYGVLPPRELQSALRLVASVTSTVSRCLGIVLPHPILLVTNHQSNNGQQMGDITDTVSEKALYKIHSASSSSTTRETSRNAQPQQGGAASSSASSALSSSFSSLISGSTWKKTAKSAFKKMTTTGQQSFQAAVTSKVVPASSSASSSSLDAHQVQQRIHHATAAVIAENSASLSSLSSSSSASSRYSLSSEVMNQEEFTIALQLLQNNVICLCIRAGVPVRKLYPGEALLLNLHALQVHCMQQLRVEY